MKTTVSIKGQITVPLKLRKRLGIEPGQVLEFDESAPYLKATKVIDVAAMRAVIGIARDRLEEKTLDEWMEWLRGPVELPPEPVRKSRSKARQS